MIKKPENNKMLKKWSKLAKTRNKSGNIRDKIIKIKQTKFLKRQPYKIKKNRRSGKIKTTLDNNKDKKTKLRKTNRQNYRFDIIKKVKKKGNSRS